MKTIVSVQEISEFDIKPGDVVAQWRSLVETEISRQWNDRSCWNSVRWPGCLPEDELPAFTRLGFSYVECRSCGSLFAPLRPSEDELWTWYRNGEAARFWREKMLSVSKSARLEKIIRPRADWVLEGLAEYVPHAERLVDISTYGRDLLDIIAVENSRLPHIVSAGMTADLEGKTTPRVQVRPARLKDLPDLGPADAVVAIDTFDRIVDFDLLVDACHRLLRPGGVLFATVPVASGFEIQALWEHSPTVVPPDKLNLPSVRCLTTIFSAPSWAILELSTPGMFDIDLVQRVIEQNPAAGWPRIIRSLTDGLSANDRRSFVEFLQSSRLASFARLVARKAR